MFLKTFLSASIHPKGDNLSPYPKAIAFIILTTVSARFNPLVVGVFPAKTVPDLQKSFSSAKASH